jgi:hypothetical protein
MPHTPNRHRSPGAAADFAPELEKGGKGSEEQGTHLAGGGVEDDRSPLLVRWAKPRNVLLLSMSNSLASVWSSNQHAISLSWFCWFARKGKKESREGSWW